MDIIDSLTEKGPGNICQGSPIPASCVEAHPLAGGTCRGVDPGGDCDCEGLALPFYSVPDQ